MFIPGLDTDGREARAGRNGAWVPFRPAPWLPGRHFQTAVNRYFRWERLPMRRETWETPDGDVLALDWVDGAAGSPVFLALPGLEGNSRSMYMHGLMRRAQARGWRGLALNFRSCAPPPGRPKREWVMNTGRRVYHAGETSDLDWVIGRLVEREPGLTLVVTGVSLGGNVLLKWLGERDGAARELVRAAATISAPHDLAAASAHLTRGMGLVYTAWFLGRLKAKALAYDERYPGVIDMEAIRRARSFREIDEAAVAPIHGFRDAEDYYARSSSIAVMDRIRVPTLVINAADDPFVPAHVLPRVRECASDAVTCLFTRKGAHVGFVEGPPWDARWWAEDRAVEFLSDHLA
jgi:predicted alpha/beta-fold hydrolase